MSKEVSTFDELKELMLIEEFKSCCTRELKLHLEELKLTSLQENAIASDEYVLSHRNLVYQNRWRNQRSNNSKGDISKKETSSVKEESKPGEESIALSKNKRSPKGSPTRYGKKVICYYCQKPGHVRANCYAFKKYLEQQKPIGLLSCMKNDYSCVEEGYKEFLSKGQVSSCVDSKLREVNVLRDTGALQSLILRSALPFDYEERKTEYILLGGFPNTVSSCPLESLFLKSKWFNGLVRLAVVDVLPMKGVDVIIANDIAVGSPVTFPIVNDGKKIEIVSCDSKWNCPVNVVTRSMAKQVVPEVGSEINDVVVDNVQFEEDDGSTVNVDRVHSDVSVVHSDQVSWDQDSLKEEQLKEFEIYDSVDNEPDEVMKPMIVWLDGLLYRFSRDVKAPAEKCEVKKQIMVPSVFRKQLVSLAHEDHLSGHFGVKKTLGRLITHFYWPNIKKDCKRFVNTCHVCQVIGKPNQKIPKALLCPLPIVDEPFQEVQIDIVGPLPRTRSGNEYILTIIDRMSNYPEAIPIRRTIPIRSSKSKKVIEELIKFFTKFGLPKVLQSDCGSNFTSKLFAEHMHDLGIQHITSTPYHPESQGKIERFHQTMKSMIKKYCMESGSDWDKELPYLLFAFRSAPSESLGYSPFQLIFGHCVRGPLDVVRECWEENDVQLDLLTYLSELNGKLSKAWNFAKEHLIKIQQYMKVIYDKIVKVR